MVAEAQRHFGLRALPPARWRRPRTGPGPGGDGTGATLHEDDRGDGGGRLPPRPGAGAAPGPPAGDRGHAGLAPVHARTMGRGDRGVPRRGVPAPRRRPGTDPPRGRPPAHAGPRPGSGAGAARGDAAAAGGRGGAGAARERARAARARAGGGGRVRAGAAAGRDGARSTSGGQGRLRSGPPGRAVAEAPAFILTSRVGTPSGDRTDQSRSGARVCPAATRALSIASTASVHQSPRALHSLGSSRNQWKVEPDQKDPYSTPRVVPGPGPPGSGTNAGRRSAWSRASRTPKSAARSTWASDRAGSVAFRSGLGSQKSRRAT